MRRQAVGTRSLADRPTRLSPPAPSRLADQAARAVASLAVGGGGEISGKLSGEIRGERGHDSAGQAASPSPRSRAPAFVELFVEQPTHELAYYTYLEQLHHANAPARRHRFVSAKEVTDDFFRARGFADGTPWKSGYAGCAAAGVQLWEWARHLAPLGGELGCELLARFGYHALRFQTHSAAHPCYSGAQGLAWLRSLARRCTRSGRMAREDLRARAAGGAHVVNASRAGDAPMFEWWLSEAALPPVR